MGAEADVRHRGEPLGREIFVEPGKHVVEVRAAGYEPARREVEAATGPDQEMAMTLVAAKATAMGGPNGGAKPAGGPRGDGAGGAPSFSREEGAGGGPRTELLIAGGVTAGAALVAGVIFTVVANGKANDAEAQREALVKAGGPAACASGTPACDELLSSVDAKDSFTTAAVWSFVGAGVLGAATGIYAVTAPKSEGAARARAEPAIMAGGGGGTLSSTGYSGIAGQPGLPGGPGQGGGGGGGAKGKSGCAGASGGGGGAGGCGGKGGLGGQAGGASIGIVSLGATLSFDTVTVRTGNGGDGGEGGDGQGGGIGGLGGTGGLGDSNAPATLAACGGGNGGQGGTGGKGGGGRGGHSIGIAHTGAAPSVDGVTIQTGTPGNGGTGADPQHDGAAGAQVDMQEFP